MQISDWSIDILDVTFISWYIAIHIITKQPVPHKQ
jgi:hypothetical protein